METGPTPEAQLDRDFARATSRVLVQWLAMGTLVVLLAVLYAASRSAEPVPFWFVGVYLASMLVSALAFAGIVQLRARRARRFVKGFAPRVRECGLSGNTLVVILDNNLIVSVQGSPMIPAGRPWVSAERIYGMDRKVRSIDLQSYRHLRRRVLRLDALRPLAGFADTYPQMQEIARALGDHRRRGPALGFREREVGTKAGPKDTVREAEVDFLILGWHAMAATIVPYADRLAALLDQGMELAWDGHVGLGQGSPRSRG